MIKIERDKTVWFLCSDKINKLVMKNAQKDIKLKLKENLKIKKNDKNKKPMKPIKLEEYNSQIDFNSCFGNEDFNNN